jgi:methionyl-tRNA formyltransferase
VVSHRIIEINMLRVVLVGYGELAASLMLGVIESGHKLAGIFRWDMVEYNPVQRCLKDLIYPDNFTSLIKSYKIPEISAKSVNSQEFKRQVLRLQPDVIMIGSWGEIFKKETIILPRMGCINCHPSLLPKHRGSNPYTSVIREGETETGITFHLVDKGIDTGPILIQKRVPVLIDDTGGSLRTRCSYEARKTIKELLDNLETAKLIPQKQDENEASYFPRLSDANARIDWSQPALTIHNNIRAHQPWMKCYTQHRNNFLMLSSTKLVSLNKPADVAGVVLAKKNGGLIVSTGDSDRGIFLEKLHVYGFLNQLYSKFCVNGINTGDVLE